MYCVFGLYYLIGRVLSDCDKSAIHIIFTVLAADNLQKVGGGFLNLIRCVVSPVFHMRPARAYEAALSSLLRGQQSLRGLARTWSDRRRNPATLRPTRGIGINRPHRDRVAGRGVLLR
jgi:hypothetical protein